MKRFCVVLLAAISVLVSSSAQANHQTSSGMILLGGAPQSFCAGPPGYPIHKQNPEISEKCFAKPTGAMGAIISYRPVHQDSWLGCFDQGSEIAIYGGGANPFPPVLPTVAQSFTVKWQHSPTGWCVMERL